MKIAIIGCGNMGRGLAQRLSTAHQLFLYDRNIEKSAILAQEGYGKGCKNLQEVIDSSELVILAIKPQNLKESAPLISQNLNENQMIISLLAGTPLSTLKNYFPHSQIIRMMPNLALIHGEGIIGLSHHGKISKEVLDNLTNTFELLGKVYWLQEDKIDAITSLAGSGPAFIFTMIEAMIDAGIAMGFNVKEAQGIVFQMIKGSLTLLEKSNKHPGELKWQIASPEGTTIAGLKKLEEQSLRSGIIHTFLAAYERSKQLSFIHEEKS